MALPPDWMPNVPMKRVVCHWTAGSHSAGETDKDAYHILVEGNGGLVRGRPSIALNSGRVKSGYAAHTLNCNSGSIGVSLCCMAGAEERPFSAGRYPMTRTQWDALVVVVAELCNYYRIKVTPRTVLSHAEVESTLGIQQRGKWDFTRLPFDASVVGPRACGDRLRKDVMAAMGAMPNLPVRPGRDTALETAVRRLLDELWPILARGLAAGFNTLVREILKRMR
ncbi:N-acetylmuramoyl-L-alanine amidase [Mesorhizobium sp. YC-39]|uniref:peptidoglycan recognition protein family protein n=1 Tax=unclassified Mesorhizobium TaxID=325217 RepID=UPI0021E6FC2C|nr:MULTISPECIES: peptidoglycan recognition family protein [unclassified Mesorhizobium]MCV3209578.1 N-acetylmuramoyl-L-alanine amidase [Mesorhizobium sp. YC-2]MCV3230108.1 N-acetylmuramoyl-L-alanine amidase [Mesorhizobium sp. YC-39]